MEAGADFDSNFDPNLALTLLFELGRERSVQGLMEKLTTAAVGRPVAIARAEVWLIEKGDICSQCPRRAECPDQTRCLHLAAARNNPLPGTAADASAHYQFDTRLPLGVGVIGTIATTGQPVMLRDLHQEPRAAFPVEWLRREQIRGFHGTPITFKG
jgi:GAF domain-containing protein